MLCAAPLAGGAARLRAGSPAACSAGPTGASAPAAAAEAGSCHGEAATAAGSCRAAAHAITPQGSVAVMAGVAGYLYVAPAVGCICTWEVCYILASRVGRLWVFAGQQVVVVCWPLPVGYPVAE
jgi:hypothetical protein